MILDELFGGDGDKATEGENAKIKENKNFTHNEQLEKEKEYKQDQSNNKSGNDATAARYEGANGYDQRADQKDQLENLHIGGDDLTPQGGTNHSTDGEQAQGPGFAAEGSYELGPGIRMHEQELGSDAADGPAEVRN